MARRDLAGAAGLAALATAYLVANRRYSLDTLAAPGPGVFPLAVALLLLGLAVCQAAIAMRRPGRHPAPHPSPDGASAPWRAIALGAALVAYAAAAGQIGLLTASFALVLAGSRILGARDWLRPALLAAGVTAAAYVIFVLWLAVPLPRGPLP